MNCVFEDTENDYHEQFLHFDSQLYVECVFEAQNQNESRIFLVWCIQHFKLFFIKNFHIETHSIKNRI